jgi:hypothetical protein
MSWHLDRMNPGHRFIERKAFSYCIGEDRIISRLTLLVEESLTRSEQGQNKMSLFQ